MSQVIETFAMFVVLAALVVVSAATGGFMLPLVPILAYPFFFLTGYLIGWGALALGKLITS